MLVVAHITDIHICSDSDSILARPEKIGAAIASHIQPGYELVVLVTGDIAYSGTAEQYELALTFFKRIEDRIRKDFNGSIRFVACPGNHDCDFSGPQDLRNLVLKQLSEKPADELSAQFLETCLLVQDNFFKFLSDLTGVALSGAQRLRYTQTVRCSGIDVTFDCLNVAWASQIREQYSRIPRVRREQIIQEMLEGPLRALEVFYESLRENPESVVAEYESRLAEGKNDLSPELRRALAQRVVGSIVLGITFAFIRKVAEAVGSEAISDDLRAIVQKSGHLGHKLVRLAALLDAQRGLPRVDIEKIRKDGADSLIVDRVIQVLVVYHMYMFRTNYPDIRWAHEVLGIPNRVKLRTMLSGGPLPSVDS